MFFYERLLGDKQLTTADALVGWGGVPTAGVQDRTRLTKVGWGMLSYSVSRPCWVPSISSIPYLQLYYLVFCLPWVEAVGNRHQLPWTPVANVSAIHKLKNHSDVVTLACRISLSSMLCRYLIAFKVNMLMKVSNSHIRFRRKHTGFESEHDRLGTESLENVAPKIFM